MAQTPFEHVHRRVLEVYGPKLANECFYKCFLNNNNCYLIFLSATDETITTVGRKSAIVPENAMYRGNVFFVEKILLVRTSDAFFVEVPEMTGVCYFAGTIATLYKTGELVRSHEFNRAIEDIFTSGIHVFVNLQRVLEYMHLCFSYCSISGEIWNKPRNTPIEQNQTESDDIIDGLCCPKPIGAIEYINEQTQSDFKNMIDRLCRMKPHGEGKGMIIP
jgi:hypothetical protein